MQIVEASSHASLDGYALSDAPMPHAGPGQILIKVAMCGVSYVDALVALGRYQVKPPLPHIPGSEIAGTVAVVGAGVTGLAAISGAGGSSAGILTVRRSTSFIERTFCTSGVTARSDTMTTSSGGWTCSNTCSRGVSSITTATRRPRPRA